MFTFEEKALKIDEHTNVISQCSFLHRLVKCPDKNSTGTLSSPPLNIATSKNRISPKQPVNLQFCYLKQTNINERVLHKTLSFDN